MYNLSQLISFIYAYAFSNVFLVYFLKLPLLISNQKEIIKEYYAQNFNSTFFLDFVLILVYLLVACFFANLFNVQTIPMKFIIVVLTTILITGSFMLYYTSKKNDGSFWSRWFHLSGYKSVLYDIILVSFVYLIYEYIYNIADKKTI
jgi:hypothetical protein|tara:strand:+ start:721 stop:1161 length:441 start_codon:yes stop_codon:yes gene_type:complete